MKLRSVHIKNFRCLADVTIEFGDPTILLGPNSAGKSSLLHALAFFFDGTDLEVEDVFGSAAETVTVECTFTGLDETDRAVFGPYAEGEQMVLRRSWKAGEGHKLTGRGRRYSGFEAVRAKNGRELTAAYKEFRASHPELGLPEANNMSAVEQAMLTWEQDNPDECEPVDDQDASSLFGYGSVGKAKLADRFPFVLVPGISDAAAEAVEKKGSLLSRLLTAVADQRARADAKLQEIELDAREKYKEAVQVVHAPVLKELGDRLSHQIRRYVPSAQIQLEPSEASVRVEPPRVVLKGGEETDLTDLGRQGHGFQRAFVISVLEYLADIASAPGDGVSRPTLFLAIEEPELYQHPPRARHFQRTLSRLAREETVQICYATHSPYFVSADQFDAVRVFGRGRVVNGGRGSSVRMARVQDVESELPEPGKYDLRRYLERTLSEKFREVFFAKAVLLVEGPTDAAIFETATELYGLEPLGADGIVVATAGKSVMPIALAILRSLDIPAYCVFDADGGATDGKKCQECGAGKQNRTSAISANKKLLAALGAEEVDFPETQANERWGCFATTIEDSIPGFSDKVAEVLNEASWGGKSPESYAEAVRRLGAGSLPGELREMLEKVKGLILPQIEEVSQD